MKVKAKIDLEYHGKKHKAGQEFDALADDAQDMLAWGWIEGTPPVRVMPLTEGYIAEASSRTVSASELWVTVNGWPTNAPPGFDAYCHYLTDWQLIDSFGNPIPGCTVDYSYQNGIQPAHDGIDGKKWVGYMPAYLHLKLPEMEQPFGHYKFQFTLNCIPAGWTSLEGGGIQTLDVPVFVAQHPRPVHSDSTHPIPGLDRWQAVMVELADKWAPQLLDPANVLGESNWYYDIASTYLEINRYLKTDRYFEVAQVSARRYADYLTSNGGVPAPWCVFPRGLRQMYQSTQDSSWCELLKGITKGGWVAYGGSPDPMLMRETAYALAEWLELTWIGASDPVMIERGIGYSLTQLNKLFVQELGRNQGMVCEPFFAGLMMQSLIDAYEIKPDERIPPALTTVCNWLWENAVDGKTGYSKYDAFTPTTDWYTGLNPLMYNAWAFLYSVTGQDVWRQQGDILFEHTFDDQAYSWSPKQFGQIYRRSIDYVTKWRA